MSAGKGHPYWYEWTVGLRQIVEMLDGDAGIASVSLQVAGIKGWDDVVVRKKDGTLRMFQVKHTRIGETLTFGDLVGDGLLGELAKAWVETKAPVGSTCVLFTNRAAGERESRTKKGTLRPALEEFWAWLKGELLAGKSFGQCVPPENWRDAWQEWCEALKGLSEQARADFIRALSIEADQADLERAVSDVQLRLATLFGIADAKAATLLPALHQALRLWSTKQETVRLEDLLGALALEDPEEAERHSPPPRRRPSLRVEGLLWQRSQKR